MDIGVDQIELGCISQEMLEPIAEVFSKNDWSGAEYARHEITLLAGKLVVLPYPISQLSQRNYTPNQKHLLDTVQPLIDYVLSQFPGYVPVRGELAAIPPNKFLNLHFDDRWFHANCRRIHVPIVTNDRAYQIFDDRKFHLEYGKMYEINNRILHSAVNNGTESRIHLIIDLLDKKLYDEINGSVPDMIKLVLPEKLAHRWAELGSLLPQDVS